MYGTMREAILDENWKSAERMLEAMTSDERDAVWRSTIQATRALRDACAKRQSTPVWIDSAGKMLIDGCPEELNKWASGLARGRSDIGLDPQSARRTAREAGALYEAQALGVLWHLVEATAMDVAKLCEVEVDVVLGVFCDDTKWAS